MRVHKTMSHSFAIGVSEKGYLSTDDNAPVQVMPFNISPLFVTIPLQKR